MGKTGQFGKGFNSYYHITDVIQIVRYEITPFNYIRLNKSLTRVWPNRLNLPFA